MKPSTDFSIRSFIGGYDKNITYLINCNRTGAQILVDASVELSQITPYINNNPLALMVTHGHKDHTAYLDQYISHYPSLVIVGHSASSINHYDRYKDIHDGEVIKVGELTLLAICTPGHYFDSMCYKIDPALFTGDTMFVGRTGRVKSAKSDIEELYDSVYNKILTLPHDIRIYPGHDYGKKSSILLKENIKMSPLLQAKNLIDFKEKMKNYEDNRKSGS